MLRQHEQPPAAGWPGCEVGDCACAATGAGRPHIPLAAAAAVLAAPEDDVAAACCIVPHASAGVVAKAAARAKLNLSFLIVLFLERMWRDSPSVRKARAEGER